jgi:DNA invertase Pin-like site-specific DNA recombinase
MPTTARPVAFSYLRFSSPQQAAGDTVRRQTQDSADWCRRNKIPLDTALRDEGTSAFKGKHRSNPDEHALASFLQLVKSGRVPEGSYLLVENLDRLSRESIVPAVNLFTGILLSGIKIVQLRPVEQVFTAGADMTSIMLALVELSRGHSESQMKSERVGAAWANKKRRAAERIVTRKLPGWVCVEGDDVTLDREQRRPVRDGDKLVLIPERAETVRRVYRLALAGHGVHMIAKMLNESGVPVLGRTEYKGRPVVWSETVVYHLLNTRAVIGEYQPCKGRGSERQPVGDPIRGYFPAVVSEHEFYAVQALLRSRAKVGRGRRGKHVNLFAGLLRDARDGGSLTYKHLRSRASAIIPVGAKHGRNTTWTSFCSEPFEAAVLSQLREVKASDVFPDRGGAGQRVEAAAARLAETEGLIAKWRAKMDVPELVDTVAEKLGELEAKRRRQAEELAEARQEASSPLSESWGEFRSLGDLLAADDTPDLREKVRAALRRTVDSVWVLIAKGRPRLCAVQVWFKGEPARHRDYVILHIRPVSNGKMAKKPGRWFVRSLALPGKRGDLDLRRPTDAAALAEALEAADWSGPAADNECPAPATKSGRRAAARIRRKPR